MSSRSKTHLEESAMSTEPNPDRRERPRSSSRRDLIKSAAVGAAGAGLGLARAADAADVSAEVPSLEDCDVAIVGAGVAGCYLAYRLANATLDDLRPDSPLRPLFANKSKLDVALFEYSGRVGGRLLSVKVPGINADEPGAEGVGESLAEFGGFRFARTMHIVWNTAQHLGLTDEPFNFDCDDNLVYVRGQHLTREEVNGPSGAATLLELYNLTEFEAGLLKQGGTGAISDYVSDQAFQHVLPNATPSEKKQYGLGDAPNGYTLLRSQFHAAFLAAEKAEAGGGSADALWKQVKQYGDAYEAAKASATAERPYVFGRPLSDWSGWALNRHVLSQEAVDLLEDAGGYNSEGFAGNFSANTNEDFYFVVGPFGDEPGCSQTDVYYWRHIREGYSAIPGNLWKRFDALGRSYFNHQLVSFENVDLPGGKKDAGPYDLLFYRRQPGIKLIKGSVAAENICRESPEQCRRIRAKLLFLALPGRSLELIDQDNFFFQDSRVQALTRGTVNNIPALRMFIAYSEPWWLRYGIDPPAPGPAMGRNTTDLGLRQYYNWWTPASGNANQNGLTLASYVSGQATFYWKEIQDGDPYDHEAGGADPSALTTIPPAKLGKEGYSKATAGQAAAAQKGGPRHCSKTMALEAHRQLMEVSNVPEKDRPDIPLPYYAHFQNWTKDPFGAGWHAWGSGSDQQRLIPAVRQPIPEASVFIVGEAFSDVQGWVQGALNSAESTLQCKLRLTWPEFINPYGTWLGNGTRWLVPGGTDDPCVPEGEERGS